MDIYYFRTISKIGGIETFLYELAKKYRDRDIMILYCEGDYEQILRLKEHVKVEKYESGKKYKCEKAFFNFNLDAIDNIEAKEYNLVLHGDYKKMIEDGHLSKENLPYHKKINNIYGVSKVVCDGYKELTGREVKLCYNPLEKREPKRLMRLISATRLSPDKGKNRIEKLGKMLNEAGIRYEWRIFTTDTKAIDNENIIYMKPRLDIGEYIKDADYLVQLSDAEGYCYSVVEALSYGTPVIVTDMPVIKEIGVKDKINGYIADFDLNNINVLEIYKNAGKMAFKYEINEDIWGDILSKGKSKYLKEIDKMFKVRCIMNFKDLEEGKERKANEEFVVDFKRKEYLLGNNPSNLKVIEVIEEVKEEEEEKVEVEIVEKKKEKKPTKKPVKKASKSK